MKCKIKINVVHGNLRIMINGMLHLSIQLGGFFGVQSYVMDDIYYIVYYTESGEIETDYIDIEIWKQILKQLTRLKFI